MKRTLRKSPSGSKRSVRTGVERWTQGKTPMSYLHIPRICIEGRFEAGGVTANNVLAAREEVNTPAFDPLQNGWHYYNLASNQFSILAESSRVVSAWDANGPVKSDPVIGAMVAGDGIMADLDPEHRRATDLFGFELAIGLPPPQPPVTDRGELTFLKQRAN